MQLTRLLGTRRSRLHALASLPLAASLVIAAPSGTGLEAGVAQAQGCKGTRANPSNVKPARASSAVLCLINKRRQSRGIPKVRGRKPLRATAKRHSRHMLRTRCFAHRCPGQKDLAGRVHETAYLPCGCNWGLGETIAAAHGPRGKPRRIVRSWMRSPGHRRILLDRRLRHAGVGVMWGAPWSPGSSDAGTYTADFGFKR
jgi:uncharacterized protein YkwD